MVKRTSNEFDNDTMLDRLCASDLVGNKQIKQIGMRLADEVKTGNPAKHYQVKRRLQANIDNIYECQNKADNTKTAIMNLANKPSERDIIEFKDQLLQS